MNLLEIMKYFKNKISPIQLEVYSREQHRHHHHPHRHIEKYCQHHYIQYSPPSIQHRSYLNGAKIR
ncbi:unnamed protein product [Heterobilharzia americana]|nr:unnamed protein product [Heterobilharzia americana]CAH8580194.1 unnamed protein product [Heterobilharzia americana]